MDSGVNPNVSVLNASMLHISSVFPKEGNHALINAADLQILH